MKVRVVALLLPLVLAGCGSGTTSSAASGSASAAAPVVSSATPAQPTSAATAQGTAEGAVDGAPLCTFLRDHQSELTSVGSPVGTLAQLTIALSGWVEQHPDQKPGTAADLDTAATAGCPDVRTAYLAALQKPSFEAAFSGG